jgi:hypothetical protein
MTMMMPSQTVGLFAKSGVHNGCFVTFKPTKEKFGNLK